MVKANEKQTKIEDEFTELSSEATFWSPKEGDEVTGKIIKRTKGKYGYTFFLENDNGVLGLPSHTVLVDLLNRCMIGDVVKIQCVGSTPSDKGNDTMLYKVFLKKSN